MHVSLNNIRTDGTSHSHPSALVQDIEKSIPMMTRTIPAATRLLLLAAIVSPISAVTEAIAPGASADQACTYTCPETDTSGDLLVFFTPLPPYTPGEEFIC